MTYFAPVEKIVTLVFIKKKLNWINSLLFKKYFFTYIPGFIKFSWRLGCQEEISVSDKATCCSTKYFITLDNCSFWWSTKCYLSIFSYYITPKLKLSITIEGFNFTTIIIYFIASPSRVVYCTEIARPCIICLCVNIDWLVTQGFLLLTA